MNLQTIRQKAQGFTLIELLVVITLIAILAVAVLAAINPIEQRRKAQDTGAIKIASELIGAQERFFAQYGCYTWNWDNAGAGCGADALNDLAATAVSAAAVEADDLIQTGEVKPDFGNRLDQLNGDFGMTIYTDADQSLHVGFTPLSSAFQNASTCTAVDDCTGCNAGGAITNNYCVPDSE